jgi:hypothetical protein
MAQRLIGRYQRRWHHRADHYCTGKARLNTPVGFSDPSIAAVIIAEEIIVKQGVSPGGRTLLYLNPHALNNSDQMLLPTINWNEAPLGFVVIVYGGERYSYHITPLMSDGTPYNQSVRVVYSSFHTFVPSW